MNSLFSNKQGIVFTISMYFMVVGVMGLLLFFSDHQSEKFSYYAQEDVTKSLFFARDDIGYHVLEYLGVQDVVIEGNGSEHNMSFVGSIPLSTSTLTPSTYISYYNTTVSNRSHVELDWADPEYNFTVEPFNHLLFYNGSVNGIFDNYSSLAGIEVVLSVEGTVTNSTAPWSDSGAGNPTINITVYHDGGAYTSHVRRDPTAAITGIFLNNSASIQFGSFGGNDAVLLVESDSGNVTFLSVLYNDTNNPIGLYTQQIVKLQVLDEVLEGPLLITDI